MDVRVGIDVELEPVAAFSALADELGLALARLGLSLEPGADGRVLEGAFEVGRVVAWEPGSRIALEWRAADWEPDAVTAVELSFEPAGTGTRIELVHRGWGSLVGDGGELAGWFAGEVVAPLLRATAPAGFGDWLTDRHARRPVGAQAREVYREPLYHRPNFAVLLEELALGPEDVLLEVGCGGGALLADALRSGCRAGAVDHSAEMVRLAREVNAEAVADGRLEVHEASAERLPFADGTFTAATMTSVLGFLPDPVAALREVGRVLASGARVVVLGSSPAWRGTPAAPEPMASRLRFYEDDELARLAVDAGLTDVRVVRRSLAEQARAAGIPEEDVPLFAAADTPFLLARKAGGG